MDATDPLNPVVSVSLAWEVPPERVAVIRGGDRFACTARYPNDGPMDHFSIVLEWPTDDPNEARLRLLVPTEANLPMSSRLVGGAELEVTEGLRRIAHARVLRGPNDTAEG